MWQMVGNAFLEGYARYTGFQRHLGFDGRESEGFGKIFESQEGSLSGNTHPPSHIETPTDMELPKYMEEV
ncbi:hypothetical protein SBOR_10147 [Sclerotinia borealis F-4128]|uniref:Uncharacterized protein n=1 Tax=Sclerotinia borealis (strain F-4128) TaxID=1432307 RepID=W9C191_SCLBF|nr:hypothetical protein SBOR_10147 [Sclerotinia borealis F-4128]